MTRHLFLASLLLLAACKGSGDKAKDTAQQGAASTPKTTPDAGAPKTAPADAAPEPQPVAALPGFSALVAGKGVEADARAALLAGLKVIAEDCEGGDTDTLDVMTVDVATDVAGAETVGASLAYGVFARSADKVIATSKDAIAPCDGSQTEAGGLYAGQVVPDPELEIVFLEQNGGRNMSMEVAHVFKRKGDQLVEVFTAVLREWEGEDETAHKVSFNPDGTFTVDGKTHAWDAAAFSFAEKR